MIIGGRSGIPVASAATGSKNDTAGRPLAIDEEIVFVRGHVRAHLRHCVAFGYQPRPDARRYFAYGPRLHVSQPDAVQLFLFWGFSNSYLHYYSLLLTLSRRDTPGAVQPTVFMGCSNRGTRCTNAQRTRECCAQSASVGAGTGPYSTRRPLHLRRSHRRLESGGKRLKGGSRPRPLELVD